VLCFVVVAVIWIAFDRMYPQAEVRGEQVALPLPATAGSSSLRSSE
jgi:hypothetical protein